MTDARIDRRILWFKAGGVTLTSSRDKSCLVLDSECHVCTCKTASCLHVVVLLHDDFMDHSTVNVGQPKVSTGVAERQSFVINSEEM